MSLFLVFLAIVLAGIVLLLIYSPSRSTGESAQWQRGEPAVLDGLLEPLPNLPPVLLPDHPEPADVDRVRFSLGLRGYRMDQVDEVLDRLSAELADKEDELARLRAQAPDNG